MYIVLEVQHNLRRYVRCDISFDLSLTFFNLPSTTWNCYTIYIRLPLGRDLPRPRSFAELRLAERRTVFLTIEGFRTAA